MKLIQANRLRKQSLAILKKAHIAVRNEEAQTMEIADFGLGDIKKMGLQLVVYENNDRYCAKELVLLPRQTCPEHRHPAREGMAPGKMETFRCRWGEVYLYVSGPPATKPKAKITPKYLPHFTVWHEIVLRPGDQYTLPPNTLHWFQGGPKGAVVSEFSSSSDDGADIFTDPAVRRMPVYE